MLPVPALLGCVVYFLPLPPDALPPPFAVLLLRPPAEHSSYHKVL